MISSSTHDRRRCPPADRTCGRRDGIRILWILRRWVNPWGELDYRLWKTDLKLTLPHEDQQNMVAMSGQVLGVYKDIVDVNDHKSMEKLPEHLVHKPLEDGQFDRPYGLTVWQAIWHNPIFIVTWRGNEQLLCHSNLFKLTHIPHFLLFCIIYLINVYLLPDVFFFLLLNCLKIQTNTHRGFWNMYMWKQKEFESCG